MDELNDLSIQILKFCKTKEELGASQQDIKVQKFILKLNY